MENVINSSVRVQGRGWTCESETHRGPPSQDYSFGSTTSENHIKTDLFPQAVVVHLISPSKYPSSKDRVLRLGMMIMALHLKIKQEININKDTHYKFGS